MQSVYLQRNMKKYAAKGYEKQSQNKPNFRQESPCFSFENTKVTKLQAVTFSDLDDNLVRKVLNHGFMVRLSLSVSN